MLIDKLLLLGALWPTIADNIREVYLSETGVLIEPNENYLVTEGAQTISLNLYIRIPDSYDFLLVKDQ